ncbi:MAG: exodeoxyribonuclease VII large subunit [Clostridia bacterium]|nr:exodeoxyribonuclease VII large subunit [Deltaproteobacteria bacterium]
MSSGRINPALLALRRGSVAKADKGQGSLFDRSSTPGEILPPLSPPLPSTATVSGTAQPSSSRPSATLAPLPAAVARAPLTVSQLTGQLRQLVERTFDTVLVTGEITGMKSGHGGHCYFSLKDDGAKIDAVMWSRDHKALKFKLETGMQVVARGKLTIYPPHGKYQLTIDRIEPVGAGALQAAFEQIKMRLAAEGLFAPERKRRLAILPLTVAIVTSPTGAVIRDIVTVATRRFPQARLLLVPAKVQGVDAAQSIVYALKRASQLALRGEVSVVIVARGGGAMEDLWCFNDERVARAVVACPMPVVSGVGHETDFTICDFVADVRAPTPSAAAELVFPVAQELRARVGRPLARIQRALRHDITRDRRRLEIVQRALGDGRSLLRDHSQRLDATMARIEAALTDRLHDGRLALQKAASRIERAHPAARLISTRACLNATQTRIAAAWRSALKDQRNILGAIELRMRSAVRSALKDSGVRLAHNAGRLHALSPLAVLTRGYSLTRTPDGRVIRRASDVTIGDRVDIRFERVQIRAVVEAIDEEDCP